MRYLTTIVMLLLVIGQSHAQRDLEYVPYCDEGTQIRKVFYEGPGGIESRFIDEAGATHTASGNEKPGVCNTDTLKTDLQVISITDQSGVKDTFIYCRTLSFAWGTGAAGTVTIQNKDGSTVTLPAGIGYNYPISSFMDSVIIDATLSTDLYVTSDCRESPCLNLVPVNDCSSGEPLEGWQTNGVYWSTGGVIWNSN